MALTHRAWPFSLPQSHAGKVVLRSWYEKNKHIFPASRWEPYDPEKKWDKYTVRREHMGWAAGSGGPWLAWLGVGFPALQEDLLSSASPDSHAHRRSGECRLAAPPQLLGSSPARPCISSLRPRAFLSDVAVQRCEDAVCHVLLFSFMVKECKSELGCLRCVLF